MGWSEPRSKGRRWAARYRVGKKILTIGTYATEDEADKQWQAAEAALDRGLDPVTAKTTLRDYITETWLPAVRPTLEIKTYAGYESKLRIHVLPRIGDVPLDKLRHSTVQNCMNAVVETTMGKVVPGRPTKKLSPTTCKAVRQILHMVMTCAIQDQLIEHDPTRAVKLPKKRGKSSDCWTILDPEAAPRFIQALDSLDERWRMMLILEMELAVRFSELRALRPRHFDLDSAEVVIKETIGETTCKTLDERDLNGWPAGQYRIGKTFFFKPSTKSGQERTIPIDSTVAEMLDEYITERKLEDDDLLFRSDHKLPINNSWFREKIFHVLLNEAGLPRMRLHDLRHTVTSYMLDDPCVSLMDAMAITGHSQLQSLQPYTHLLKKKRRHTVTARNKLYGRPERSLKAV